jgi:hypothetical protein
VVKQERDIIGAKPKGMSQNKAPPSKAFCSDADMAASCSVGEASSVQLVAKTINCNNEARSREFEVLASLLSPAAVKDEPAAEARQAAAAQAAPAAQAEDAARLAKRAGKRRRRRLQRKRRTRQRATHSPLRKKGNKKDTTSSSSETSSSTSSGSHDKQGPPASDLGQAAEAKADRRQAEEQGGRAAAKRKSDLGQAAEAQADRCQAEEDGRGSAQGAWGRRSYQAEEEQGGSEGGAKISLRSRSEAEVEAKSKGVIRAWADKKRDEWGWQSKARSSGKKWTAEDWRKWKEARKAKGPPSQQRVAEAWKVSSTVTIQEVSGDAAEDANAAAEAAGRSPADTATSADKPPDEGVAAAKAMPGAARRKRAIADKEAINTQETPNTEVAARGSATPSLSQPAASTADKDALNQQAPPPTRPDAPPAQSITAKAQADSAARDAASQADAGHGSVRVSLSESEMEQTVQPPAESGAVVASSAEEKKQVSPREAARPKVASPAVPRTLRRPASVAPKWAAAKKKASGSVRG